jgi:hypothetical protein
LRGLAVATTLPSGGDEGAQGREDDPRHRRSGGDAPARTTSCAHDILRVALATGEPADFTGCGLTVLNPWTER